MKRFTILNLIIGIILFLVNNLNAQVGYFDAPYTRYEADQGTLTNAAATSKSYNQGVLQSEASEQICVNLSNNAASVSWPVTVAGDGLVVRYSVPDGQSGVIEVFADNVSVGTLNLNSYYSWEYLSSNGNSNNVGVSNTNPKMRFDEVRLKLPSTIPVGGILKLVRQSSTSTIHVDFAELELVPAAVTSSAGNAVFSGGDLQTFITNNGGNTIYLLPGTYNVNNQLYFGNNNTILKGAGMWYTQINFTNGGGNQGGLWANASGVSYSGLYLTTTRNSRSSSYKAINGVYTLTSTISNVWAEHFECGAWIAQYNTGGPAVADGFKMSNCRFRNNYADGTNLCRGTKNAVVEHCNFRNNGDDDMAIWSADGLECVNNTFQYNTSENCWRASGCAIYGGYNNKAYNLLIQDNVEVGIKVNNAFGGAPFNSGGQHQFSNIIIKRCGTFYDLFNKPVGAIDLGCYNNGAGTRVQNVKFSCIDIIDSKNDAIYINKNAGDGFYNLVFENIKIDGTGREYPDNGGAVSDRGYGVLFKGNPAGNGNTYCNMTYANRSGSATVDVNTSQMGSFTWSVAGSCPTGCSLGSATTITSATSFGACTNPITLTATTTAPSGNTVTKIEFFVDGVSIGSDLTSPYAAAWNNPAAGNHSISATAYYSGGTNAPSATQVANVIDGVYLTPTPPTIDGTIEASWNGYATIPLLQGYNSPPDLAASFRTRYNATNLFILVEVTDSDLRNDSGNDWEDDNVEIFIDIGNNKTSTYQSSDFQYGFSYASPASAATGAEYKHPAGDMAMAGVTFAQGAKTGGYIMEISIPWATLGGLPTPGSYMGFDVKINDDDLGGTRDHELAWKDGTFNAWQSPALFGTVQIANCSNSLPVEWLSFTGEKNNGTVILNWATVAENNNQKFSIERSADLTHWNAIGEVATDGNSSAISTYNFTDYTLLKTTVYYRLRQVDIDGNSAYSNVVTIQSEKQSVIIAPNPFEETLSIQSNLKGNIEISLHDIVGRLVYQTSLESNEGSVSIQPEGIPAGTYVLTIRTDTFIEQQKIVKK